MVHGGKELSYLNVYDTEAAWRLVHSLGEGPAAVVIKHANPCGVAVADDITTAYVRAHDCDTDSAFGGIVAVNRPVTEAMAEALAPIFTEVVVAPGYEGASLDILRTRKTLRLLEAQAPGPLGPNLRVIDGGYLVQTPDPVRVDRGQWQVVTRRQPDAGQWADAELAWAVVARVTSNAIVLVKDGQAVGIGCGQQNRRDAGKLAGDKAAGRAQGGVYASDAFFPFPDGLDGAIAAGATAGHPARRIGRRRQGHRRRRRGRPGHGPHRRAPLPPLSSRPEPVRGPPLAGSASLPRSQRLQARTAARSSWARATCPAALGWTSSGSSSPWPAWPWSHA